MRGLCARSTTRNAFFPNPVPNLLHLHGVRSTRRCTFSRAGRFSNVTQRVTEAVPGPGAYNY